LLVPISFSTGSTISKQIIICIFDTQFIYRGESLKMDFINY
jgi:hypothetical protein